MNVVLQFLETHGPMLATGATALLTIGGVTLFLHRAPINRQRAGELTIVAVLAWMLLACIPLPRWSTSQLLPKNSPPTASQNPPQTPPTDTALPMPVGPEQLSEQAARASATAEILTQLAELDAEQPESPPVEVDLPLGHSPQTLDTAVAVVAATMIEKSPGAALAAKGFSWRQIVVGLYLGGAALSAAWIMLGWFLLNRLTQRAISPHGWLQELYTSLSSEPLPRLLVSSKCRRAFSCGWWRPTIVLPLECCEESRAEQLRQILLHELAHLQQGDQRGRVLFNIALPLLFVHPLYWWIRSRTYLAAELVADDWAAGHSSTAAYAGELIALVKEQGRRGMAHVGTVGIFSSPTQFYRRMEMLVRRQTPLMTTCTRRWRLLTTLTAIVAVAILSSTLGVRLVQAEPDDGEKKTETVEAAPAGDSTSELVPDNSEKPTDIEGDQVKSIERPAQGGKNRGFGFIGGRNAKPAAARQKGRSQNPLRIGRRWGEEVHTPDEMLATLKSMHRDILIIRLQLMNRQVTEKEREIGKLLTDVKSSDREIIERLYEKILRRPISEAELPLVQEILKVSDNRKDSILRMLESMGQLDNAASAALFAMNIGSLLPDAEVQVQKLTKAVTNLPDDIDPFDEATEAVRKGLDIPGVMSWEKATSVLLQNYQAARVNVNGMKDMMAELAKLDKELQQQQAIPSTTYNTYGPPKPQPYGAPADTSSRAVIKMVPRVVWETTADGKKTAKTVYEQVVVAQPVASPTDSSTDAGTNHPEAVATYAPPPSARPTTVPIRDTPPVPTTQQQIEPVPDSRLPSTHHDVIKLATDYSQTHSELDSAKRAYERIQKLNERGVVTQAEFEKAAGNLASMRERLKTMQTIAEILQESLEAELNALKLEMNQADKTKDEVRKAQLHTRFTRVAGDLRILKTMK